MSPACARTTKAERRGSGDPHHLPLEVRPLPARSDALRYPRRGKRQRARPLLARSKPRVTPRRAPRGLFLDEVARVIAATRRELVSGLIVANLNFAADRHCLELDVDRAVTIHECDPHAVPKVAVFALGDDVRDFHFVLFHLLFLLWCTRGLLRVTVGGHCER